MKRSFFFAVTICTLAIAAVATTKANSRFVPLGFTQDPSTGFCTVPSGIDCNGNRIDCKDASGNQLFAEDQTHECSEPLKKP